MEIILQLIYIYIYSNKRKYYHDCHYGTVPKSKQTLKNLFYEGFESTAEQKEVAPVVRDISEKFGPYMTHAARYCGQLNGIKM